MDVLRIRKQSYVNQKRRANNIHYISKADINQEVLKVLVIQTITMSETVILIL
jgi:hypothetical protein